jgi:hypothetical protein
MMLRLCCKLYYVAHEGLIDIMNTIKRGLFNSFNQAMLLSFQ